LVHRWAGHEVGMPYRSGGRRVASVTPIQKAI
jgi:hypothetical protein